MTSFVSDLRRAGEPQTRRRSLATLWSWNRLPGSFAATSFALQRMLQNDNSSGLVDELSLCATRVSLFTQRSTGLNGAEPLVE